MASAPYHGRHEVARRTVASRRRPRRWPMVALIVASGALAYLGARLAGPFASPAPDRFESALIADGYSATPNAVASIQVAAWTAVRGTSGVVAARELMVLTSVVTVLLTAALVRRFGLSVPATVLAAVVTAALPWALDAHRLVAPVNLAVPWLLGAALFASPNARRRVAAAPALLCLVIAALTAPLVVPFAVTAVAVLLAGRDIGIGWPRAARVVAVALLAVFAVATLVASLGRQPAGEIEPTAVDLVAVAAVAVGAGFGTVARWLRPFSLVVFLSVVAAVLSAPNRTPLLLIALPAAAVVLGAAFDAAAEAVGVLRRGFRTAAAATVLVLVGGSLMLAVPSAQARTPDGPAEAVAWARGQAGSALLLVDDPVWIAARDGLPDPARVLRYRDADRVGGATTALLLGSPPAPGSPPAAEAAWRRSVPLARFDRTEVRLLVTSVPAYEHAFADDLQSRRAAARALLASRAIVAPAGLANGDVDGRLLTVLTYLAGGHRFTLAELPSVPGEIGPYSVRRYARITAFDGDRVAAGTPGAGALRQWVQAQLPPFRPEVTADADGMTLGYPAPSPLGLLS
ncbi:hypothetical protein [Cryptosporangium phraense]|uniref:Glycosyltransferase family 39 protein n=1 Tax=Cryptosporangium phraense TaxID=2593070 RepID=A0A545AYU3_9ACTN|nr:hypothetical protein [Cryptosporangium phraense]TQS46458.1 hypothetical protein FL583_03460 [Cryptosporangium phraense]